jgi:hypothetical protein
MNDDNVIRATDEGEVVIIGSKDRQTYCYNKKGNTEAFEDDDTYFS